MILVVSKIWILIIVLFVYTSSSSQVLLTEPQTTCLGASVSASSSGGVLGYIPAVEIYFTNCSVLEVGSFLKSNDGSSDNNISAQFEHAFEWKNSKYNTILNFNYQYLSTDELSYSLFGVDLGVGIISKTITGDFKTNVSIYGGCVVTTYNTPTLVIPTIGLEFPVSVTTLNKSLTLILDANARFMFSSELGGTSSSLGFTVALAFPIHNHRDNVSDETELVP